MRVWVLVRVRVRVRVRVDLLVWRSFSVQLIFKFG